MGRLIWKIALHRICGNNRGRRSYRPGRRVWSAERRTVGAFGSGRHWSCRRRIRLDRPGPRSGMLVPERLGLLTPVGARLGPCWVVPPETAPGFLTGTPEGATAGFCGGGEEVSFPAGLDAGRSGRLLFGAAGCPGVPGAPGTAGAGVWVLGPFPFCI